jgi:hypothetical protein
LEVPDTEYCPPNPVALPDPPEDITYDDTFPYLRGNNLCSGYVDVYDVARDDHGVSWKERQAEESHAKILRDMDDDFRKQMAILPSMGDTNDKPNKTSMAGHKKPLAQNSNLNTIRAKNAASVLSTQPTRRLPFTAMKGTASSVQKTKPSLSIQGTTGKRRATQPSNPSPMRHTAAVAASKTTIGYSKGRCVSSILPEQKATLATKLPEIIRSSESGEARALGGKKPSGNKRVDQVKYYGLLDDEFGNAENDMADQLWGLEAHAEEDGDEEIFQLAMPEDT